jgi:hypothetical protein
MATIRVEHTIGDLEADCREIAATTKARFSRVVKRNVTQGNALAQRFARASSGPHGLNYYKRITWRDDRPPVWRVRPHGTVVGNAVGAGWRHRQANTDLEKSLDIIGPRFARDVSNIAATCSGRCERHRHGVRPPRRGPGGLDAAGAVPYTIQEAKRVSVLPPAYTVVMLELRAGGTFRATATTHRRGYRWWSGRSAAPTRVRRRCARPPRPLSAARC